ncbi:MAG: hypothetical protein R3217_01470 [Gammaproteobacteria bacterium]|nr:hypothetical protein [Gammaproteobacteria bacterium]
MNDSDLSPQEQQEIEALRRSYLSWRSVEPGELVDARIRRDARRTPARRMLAWGGLVAAAASIGLAVVLLPALFDSAPDPALELAAQREVEQAVAKAPAAPPAGAGQRSELSRSESASNGALEEQALAVEQTAARQTAERSAARAAAPVSDQAEVASSERQQEARMLDFAATDSLLASKTALADMDLEALRSELADASEREWRLALVELREHGERQKAEALFEDYRERFELPADISLDELVGTAD